MKYRVCVYTVKPIQEGTVNVSLKYGNNSDIIDSLLRPLYSGCLLY